MIMEPGTGPSGQDNANEAPVGHAGRRNGGPEGHRDTPPSSGAPWAARRPHGYTADRGIVCGSCDASHGTFGPRPRMWTCGRCGTPAPVTDIDLIPGMTDTPPGRCTNRIVHEDGAVRRCQKTHEPSKTPLHHAGDETWGDADDRVIHDPERGSVSLDDLADDALLDLNTLTPPADPALYRLTADGHWREDLDDADLPDDLDRFTAEQMQDPAFVRAWTAAQARDEGAAYARGLAEGQRLRAEHVDALTRGAYEDGKGDGRAEGRRQVTADWKREWGVRYADGAPVGAEESEAEARRVADLWGWPYEAVSRVVGPWEAAEQAPCPTCSGQVRETVGMVCQACGTDYAPAGQVEPPLSEDPVARRLGLLDAQGRVVCRCRPGQCTGHGAEQDGDR